MELFDKKGIKFVVSYAESEEADLLKKGFKCQTANVRRSIAGFINKREPAKEVIISNL
jgi:DNA adenine methylase